MKETIQKEVLKEIFPRRYKRRQVSQEIYDQLKKMILAGRLQKGQRLVEEKLANQLDVSRNPVRIAILQFRKEGLVSWKFKKGSYVT